MGRVVVEPGLFSVAKPGMVIDLQSEERCKLVSCKPWVGDCRCWDTTDETGRRRIFESTGTLYRPNALFYRGQDAILVNYSIM